MKTSGILLLIFIISLLFFFLFDLAFRRCLLLFDIIIGDGMLSSSILWREEGGMEREREREAPLESNQICKRRPKKSYTGNFGYVPCSCFTTIEIFFFIRRNMYYIKESRDGCQKACYKRWYTSNIQAIHKIGHIKSWYAKVPFILKVKSLNEIIF